MNLQCLILFLVILFLVILLLIIVICKMCKENFGSGKKLSSSELNITLLHVAKLFNNNNIHNWFLGYGTLLGIIRDNSCINNDDDVDLIINRLDYKKIKKILQKNGYRGGGNGSSFARFSSPSGAGPVELYLADIDNVGNFYDNHEKVTWSNCYLNNGELIKHKWRGAILNLPNNYNIKLENRYGKDWKIPQNSKGPKPKKNKI